MEACVALAMMPLLLAKEEDRPFSLSSLLDEMRLFAFIHSAALHDCIIIIFIFFISSRFMEPKHIRMEAKSF